MKIGRISVILLLLLIGYPATTSQLSGGLDRELTADGTCRWVDGDCPIGSGPPPYSSRLSLPD